MGSVAGSSSCWHLLLTIADSFPLPAEYERVLSSIRNLDEKSERLMVELQAKVDRCLQMQPQHSRGRAATGPEADEYTALRKEIEDDQK